jgi:putative endonuclease
MSKHADGFSKFTRGKGPWRLKYFENYSTRSEALRREKEIKRKKSSVYNSKLINNWQLNWLK